MKYYLAPMEGITGYIYRQAYHKHFHNIDRYFTPFITPHTKRSMSAREINDLLPEHNEGMELVPQLLTNQAEYFIQAQRKIREYGYDLVNLNVGCPSGTVVAKKKGAGFLGELEALDHFLEEVFAADVTRVSIKTRIGLESEEEWPAILEIYNKYPLEELIIHPRIQSDFYKKPVHPQAYEYARQNSRAGLCYNGDLFTSEAVKKMEKLLLQGELMQLGEAGDTEIKLSETVLDLASVHQMDLNSKLDNASERLTPTHALMMGRGILCNPGLIGEVKGEDPLTREKLRAFHDDILAGYVEVNSGDRNVLFKMKELWFYMIQSFADGDRYYKKIKKAQNLSDYKIAVSSLFLERNLLQ